MTRDSYNRDHEIPLRLAPDQVEYLKPPVRNLWGPAGLLTAGLLGAACIVAFDDEIKQGITDLFADKAAPEQVEPTMPDIRVNCDINGGPTTLTLADPQAGDYPTFIMKQMSGCLEGVRQGIDANQATLQGLPEGSAVHFNIGE